MTNLFHQIRRTIVGAVGAVIVSSLCLAAAMGPARAIETSVVQKA
jgi:hypothetical protein